MEVRHTKSEDKSSISALYYSAFPESENELVASVAVELLTYPCNPTLISLLAEHDAVVGGHICFSPVRLAGRVEWDAAILAPLAVKPDCQRSGIGSILVEYGLNILKERECSIVFVYGDPGYYGRFGFSTETAKSYTAPFPMQFPEGWQALILGSSNEVPAKGPIECIEPLSKPELW